ncbi:MAG TPA: alpha/beta fold hydrolase [Burkholderiales bacterium]|nr:alpha/beta fold hydrolase [Burkholderiales bacterium]
MSTDGARTIRHWFQYFPNHYMWSQGIGMAIEMIPWGAAAMGEIDRVGQRLTGREGDNAAWCEEWSRMGEAMERRAADALAQNHALTAGTNFLHAATYYGYGERYLVLGERKLEIYRRHLECFREGIARRYPHAERVAVPYEGTTLPAWFMRAGAPERKAPTVVFFNGLDGSKEVGILYGGIELAARGINTLAVDGPGQGEALRLQQLTSRYDWEVPAGAAYDYAASRSDVDPKRIAVMGISMGGYLAPRAAAMDPRFAACVAWGGHFDYHEAWLRRRREMESGGTRVSAPHFHLLWVLGVPDMDAAMEKLKRYTLAGVAEKITCPFLVVHGENDTIVPVQYAKRLYEAVGSPNKTLKIFTAEEGGAEHCQGDNRVLGANYVADWLADNL